MMKKMLALILAVLMLAPAMALAEPATYDFGDFTITYGETDVLQVGEKAEGATLFTFFPAYNEAEQFHSNINTIWTAAEGLEELEPQAFGNEVLSSMVMQMQQAGIIVTNPQLYLAEYDTASSSLMTMTSMVVDYTAALGYTLVTEQWQMQMYFPSPSGGTYVFTFTSASLDSLQTLVQYMDNIAFK